MSDDRRKYPRFKKAMAVIIHGPYTENKIQAADVSLGGVSIYNSQKYYSEGEQIYLELTLSEDDSIFCDARVVQVYPHTKDAMTYKVDLQFFNMTDDDMKRLKSCLETSSNGDGS